MLTDQMGNFSSCSCASSTTASAKLLDPHGTLHRLGIPSRAAELMLEYPGHFVSSLDRVAQTGRFVALRADDELLAGEAYVMVPCNMINRRVKPEALAVLRSASKGRRRRGRETDVGVIVRDVVEPKDGNKKKGGGVSDQQPGLVRSHRQWNPVLEPIFEN